MNGRALKCLIRIGLERIWVAKIKKDGIGLKRICMELIALEWLNWKGLDWNRLYWKELVCKGSDPKGQLGMIVRIKERNGWNDKRFN